MRDYIRQSNITIGQSKVFTAYATVNLKGS